MLPPHTHALTFISAARSRVQTIYWPYAQNTPLIGDQNCCIVFPFILSRDNFSWASPSSWLAQVSGLSSCQPFPCTCNQSPPRCIPWPPSASVLAMFSSTCWLVVYDLSSSVRPQCCWPPADFQGLHSLHQMHALLFLFRRDWLDCGPIMVRGSRLVYLVLLQQVASPYHWLLSVVPDFPQGAATGGEVAVHRPHCCLLLLQLLLQVSAPRTGTTRTSLWMGLVVTLNLLSPGNLYSTSAEGSFHLFPCVPLPLEHTSAFHPSSAQYPLLKRFACTCIICFAWGVIGICLLPTCPKTLLLFLVS